MLYRKKIKGLNNRISSMQKRLLATEERLRIAKELIFLDGQEVYVRDTYPFDPNKAYTIREISYSLNFVHIWAKNDNPGSSVAVDISSISLDPPEKCGCCNQTLK